jgi:hypothetical protein
MNVVVDFARPGDDAGVRRLVETQTMPGRVRMSFCREPNFSIGCAVTGDDCRILVARAEPDGEIVGVACRSVRRVFLNGREQRIGYLGQLRVDQRWRGRWLVSRGFALLEELHRADPVPAYLASIVEGNYDAIGVLVNKRRKSFPIFQEAARYVTLALKVHRSKGPTRGSAEVVRGSADRLEELSTFLRTEGRRRQLSSVWTIDALRRLDTYGLPLDDFRIAQRNGQIVGVVALWDQSAYKQSVIRGYSGWLKPVAPILPRPGTHLRSAYAALVSIASDDASVFDALLYEISTLASSRGFDYLLIGFDSRDRLIDIARRHRHIAYPSRLYLASWPNGGPCHEQLDAHPLYVDIATL